MENINQVTNPDGTVPGTPHMSASGGDTNVDPGTLSLNEINQTLGREYKDLPTALAAIKETYSFVGKKVEPVAAANPALGVNAPANNATQTDNFASKDEVKKLTEDLFYSQNPQYQEHRALIAKLGANPAEVVGSAEFKPLFEKAKAADDAAGQRSVVTSNARLAQTSTKLDEAVKIANTAGVGSNSLATLLAQGISEEYNLNQ